MKYFNFKFIMKILILAFIFLTPLFVYGNYPYDYRNFNDFPKYLENSDLIPIIREQGRVVYTSSFVSIIDAIFILSDREYNIQEYNGERKKIGDETYYIKGGIYYIIAENTYYGTTINIKDKPNYARAKSVEQTIKQKCKAEKRKLNSKEKKTLKYIKDYKEDIERQDLEYQEDKKRLYEIQKKETETKKKQSLWHVIFISCIIFFLIFIFQKDKNNRESAIIGIIVSSILLMFSFSNTVMWETLVYWILIVLPAIFILAPIVIYTLISNLKEIQENVKREIRYEEEQKKDKFLKYYADSKYKEAIAILNTINSSESFYFKEQNFDKIAYCYLKTSKYSLAIEIYNMKLNKNPNNEKIFYNRAIAKYKLNPKDTKDLEYIYNYEKPFIKLKKQMHLQFNDEEQKTAKQIFATNRETNKIGNIFGTENGYIYR